MTSPSDITGNLTEEDAFHIIVDYLRTNVRSDYPNFGYELYLPNTIRYYLTNTFQIDSHRASGLIEPISHIFYNAAWEMCRRGILRPGISKYGYQATPDGASGNGYSVTALGKEWLKQSKRYDYVPIEPGRLARLLSNYFNKYGVVFAERSQEAIKCYNANAYLACCAMCGAATESIILALAIAKTHDEAQVIKNYSTPGGRRKIENLIIGQKPKNIQDEFISSTGLLKYWRDISAHGRASGMTDDEAFTSLALLLRFSQFVNDKWDELIG